AGDRERAESLGLELAPVSLQQLIIRRTLKANERFGSPAAADTNVEVAR
ncbi:MAG: hypothetical protein K0Q86_2141, partial [Arthrobacter koreensis]|nr:hypothetical protein [Arthrobacter koreensis]